MTFDQFASSIAEAWERPRKYPPIATIEYVAEKGYWQASNMYGYKGSVEEWIELCRSKLRRREAVKQETATTLAAPAEPPPSDSLSIEEWLKL